MSVKDDCSKGIVRFPLGLKLAIIIGGIVLISLVTVTFLNSYFVGEDVRITAEENNLTLNSRSASSVEDKILNVRSNVMQLLDLINVVSGGSSSSLARQAQQFFFERNTDIASILIISAERLSRYGGTNINIENSRFFVSNEIDPSVVDRFLESNAEPIRRSCNGEVIALNASPYFSMPVFSLLLPYNENGREQCCIITFSTQAISDILGTGILNTTFLINDKDEILLHPDTERVLIGESLKNNPLVMELRSNNHNNENSKQIPFKMAEKEGEKPVLYYGAYQKLSMGDMVVITTIPFNTIIEGVRTVRKNNLLLTAVVLFISIALILTFARFGISRHLRKLAAAAAEIQKGNFNTDIISTLNTERGDEIGVLNQSTKDEQEFLNTFAKFTNQAVAKAIATKSIDFEPHLKDCSIFFSDIRGFTSISDGFKNRFGDASAAEIITFLNDYMGRMVDCVTLSNGNIDKFEGDAIMAVWGLLRDDDLSYEDMPDSAEKNERRLLHERHVKEDAVNSIRGTIAMRYALMEYNKAAKAFTESHAGDAKAKFKPHIQIGCGINSGRVTAGVLGGGGKMEYTVIGDAVNFASRTEATNKPCGTDILITQDTYNLLKDDYVRTKENNFTIKDEFYKDEIIVERIPVTIYVKGKGDQHFYGVVNMPNMDIEAFFRAKNPDFIADSDCLAALGPSGPKNLNEVRKLLNIPIPDFAKVNLNEEEDKTVIKQ